MYLTEKCHSHLCKNKYNNAENIVVARACNPCLRLLSPDRSTALCCSMSNRRVVTETTEAARRKNTRLTKKQHCTLVRV